MSTRICWDSDEHVACLYDSVSGEAFGEVFEGDECYEDAEHFLAYLATISVDARSVPAEHLAKMRKTFFRERPVRA